MRRRRGSGTVNAGLLGQTAYYGANGTAVSGIPSRLSFNVAAYGAKGDTQYNNTASVTSGSPAITCTTCNFTSADVGKLVWFGNTTDLPQTTILAVNSSTSITAGTNAGGTGSSQLIIWGSDDTAALSSAWTAAKASCGVVVLNAAFYITQSAQFTSAGTACNTALLYNLPSVQGSGYMSSFIVPSPNFNFGTCGGDSNSCFLGAQYSEYRDFAIWGYTSNPSGGNGKILAAINSAFLMNMDLTSWCNGCPGSIGLKILGPGPAALFGGTESFGATGIYDAGTNAQLNNFVSLYSPAAALEVHDPALISTENAFAGNIIVDTGYVWNSNVDAIASGSALTVSGRVNLNGTVFQGTQAAPIQILPGGMLSPSNISFPSIGGVSINNAGSILDTKGGNTFAGTVQAQTVLFAQTASNNANSVTAMAQTLSGTSSGSLLLAGLEWVNNGPTTTGCTDSLSNTYTQVGTTLTTGTTYGTARNYALFYSNGNKSSGSDTVTCNFSGGSANFTVLSFSEYTGQYSNGTQTTSPFEGVYTHTGSGTAR